MNPEINVDLRHGVSLPVTESSSTSHEVMRAHRTKRPLGVSILSVINAIGSVIAFLGAIGGGSALGDPDAAAAYGTIMGLFGVFSLAIAIGLWRLSNWARIAAVVLYSFSAVIGLIELSQGASSGFMQMLVAGSIAAYLCRSHAREAFKKRTD